MKLGICHICGQETDLSFEHIPPKKAFNNRPIITAKFEDIISLGPDEIPKGKVQQKGSGGYTLCENCNNLTGAWYAKQFINWCYQGIDILIKSEGKPSLTHLYNLFPLPILKEIIAMFLSVNSIEFRNKHEELAKFVLNKEKKYLPPEYQFYIYFNISNFNRMIGMTGKIHYLDETLNSSKLILMSEITYPPFGYVFTYNSPSPDERLVNISHFSRYDYFEFKQFAMEIPVLPIHLWFPGDYRTKEEILEQSKTSNYNDDDNNNMI